MATTLSAQLPPPKTAIIAVHGVADQKPNESAAQLADLLVTLSPDGSNYALESIQSLACKCCPWMLLERPTKPTLEAVSRSFKGFASHARVFPERVSLLAMRPCSNI